MTLSKAIIPFLAILLFTSCLDQSNLSSIQRNEMANDYLEQLTETTTFDASDETFIFESAKGTKLFLDPSCLRYRDNPVNGEIQLNFIEIYDKGTMAITDKHTTAINFEGELNMLESGGEFYIELTNDGNNLETTCDYKLEFFSPNITGGMAVFKGIENAESILWQPVPSDGSSVFIPATEDRYELFTTEFDWINCDRFFDYSGPKTEIEFLLPSRYADKARIYLSFDGEDYGLATPYGEFPVGKACHYIIVYENGDNYKYAIDGFTIEDDLTIEVSQGEFESIELEDLIDEINDLP